MHLRLALVWATLATTVAAGTRSIPELVGLAMDADGPTVYLRTAGNEVSNGLRVGQSFDGVLLLDADVSAGKAELRDGTNRFTIHVVGLPEFFSASDNPAEALLRSRSGTLSRAELLAAIASWKSGAASVSDDDLLKLGRSEPVAASHVSALREAAEGDASLLPLLRHELRAGAAEPVAVSPGGNEAQHEPAKVGTSSLPDPRAFDAATVARLQNTDPTPAGSRSATVDEFRELRAIWRLHPDPQLRQRAGLEITSISARPVEMKAPEP